jgi:hypothetical protein
LAPRAFEAFNRGGVEEVSGFWSQKIAFDFSPTGIPGLGVYRGYDEVRSVFEDDWFQAFPFEEWEIEVDELIDSGDQVVAMVRQRGRGGTSGAAAELEFVQITTLTERSCWSRPTSTGRGPSKPPGCGSGRCRRSRWR